MTTNAYRRPAAVSFVSIVLFAWALAAAAPASAQEDGFEPITDAMLHDPDPDDWINWRRTLDGWGYSPLDQISTDNAHRLQLVWGWSIGPGLSQATPLVHDGVMYIPNPGNGIHAVNAATGERLWQYAGSDGRSAERQNRGPSRGSRSIALYGDKVYLNTTDARIVALDARTGEVAWDHTVADRTLGYRYSSGPIVVEGQVPGVVNRLSLGKQDFAAIRQWHN